jgi:hypothetical protein
VAVGELTDWSSFTPEPLRQMRAELGGGGSKMRDPYVESLRYRLETEGGGFIDPEPIHHELDQFRVTLESGELQVEMKEHFASQGDARAAVEGFLRAWEIDAALRLGKPEIHFVFEKSTIIDRDPLPPGSSPVLEASAGGLAVVAGDLTVAVNRKEYPNPPKRFRLSPDADTLWHRYQGYVEGREPLLSMAYFCLSLLKWRAGDRRQASKEYGIQYDVLDRLGQLTATKGDMGTARKLNSYSTLTPLSQTEVEWVRAAVEAVIHRVGEYGSAGSLPQIRMSDLPRL